MSNAGLASLFSGTGTGNPTLDAALGINPISDEEIAAYQARLQAELTPSPQTIPQRGPQLEPPLAPQALPKGMQARADYVTPYVQAAADKYGVPPDILMAQMQQESGFKPGAMSNKGAGGWAQFIPSTWEHYAPGKSRADIVAATDAQAHYMRDLYDRFGDWNLALAGYNAGEGAVEKHGRKIPPYKETQNYVRSINSLRGNYAGIGGAGPAPQPAAQEEPVQQGEVSIPPGTQRVWLSDGQELFAPKEFDFAKIAESLKAQGVDAVPLKPFTTPAGQEIHVPFDMPDNVALGHLQKQAPEFTAAPSESSNYLGALKYGAQQAVAGIAQGAGTEIGELGKAIDPYSSTIGGYLQEKGPQLHAYGEQLDKDIAGTYQRPKGLNALEENILYPAAETAGQMAPYVAAGGLSVLPGGQFIAPAAMAGLTHAGVMGGGEQEAEAAGKEFVPSEYRFPYAAASDVANLAGFQLFNKALKVFGQEAILGSREAIAKAMEKGGIEEAKKVVGSRLGNIAKETGKAELGLIGGEVIEDAINREYLDKPLLSEEAFQQYGETTKQVGPLGLFTGPFAGVGTRLNKQIEVARLEEQANVAEKLEAQEMERAKAENLATIGVTPEQLQKFGVRKEIEGLSEEELLQAYQADLAEKEAAKAAKIAELPENLRDVPYRDAKRFQQMQEEIAAGVPDEEIVPPVEEPVAPAEPVGVAPPVAPEMGAVEVPEAAEIPEPFVRGRAPEAENPADILGLSNRAGLRKQLQGLDVNNVEDHPKIDAILQKTSATFSAENLTTLENKMKEVQSAQQIPVATIASAPLIKSAQNAIKNYEIDSSAPTNIQAVRDIAKALGIKIRQTAPIAEVAAIVKKAALSVEPTAVYGNMPSKSEEQKSYVATRQPNIVQEGTQKQPRSTAENIEFSTEENIRGMESLTQRVQDAARVYTEKGRNAAAKLLRESLPRKAGQQNILEYFDRNREMLRASGDYGAIAREAIAVLGTRTSQGRKWVEQLSRELGAIEQQRTPEGTRESLPEQMVEEVRSMQRMPERGEEAHSKGAVYSMLSEAESQQTEARGVSRAESAIQPSPKAEVLPYAGREQKGVQQGQETETPYRAAEGAETPEVQGTIRSYVPGTEGEAPRKSTQPETGVAPYAQSELEAGEIRSDASQLPRESQEIRNAPEGGQGVVEEGRKERPPVQSYEKQKEAPTPTKAEAKQAEERLKAAGLTGKITEEPLGTKMRRVTNDIFKEGRNTSFTAEYVDIRQPIAKAVQDLPSNVGEKLRSDYIWGAYEQRGNVLQESYRKGFIGMGREGTLEAIPDAQLAVENIFKRVGKENAKAFGDVLVAHRVRSIRKKDAEIHAQANKLLNMAEQMEDYASTLKDAAKRKKFNASARSLYKAAEKKLEIINWGEGRTEFSEELAKDADKVLAANPHLAREAENVYALLRKQVDLWEQEGMIDKATANEWRSYPNYFPLYKSSATDAKGKKISYDEMLANPTEYIQKYITPYMGRGAKSLPKVHKQERHQHAVFVEENLLRHLAFFASAAAEHSARKNTAYNMELLGKATRQEHGKGDFVVKFREKGKDVFYKIEDPAAYYALQSAQPLLNPLLKHMRSVGNFARGVMIMNPLFWYRQVFREPLQASLVGRAGVITPFDTLGEIAKIATGKSEGYKRLRAKGVIGPVDVIPDVAEYVKSIHNGKGSLQKSIDGIKHVHEAADAATRAVVYERAKAQAISELSVMKEYTKEQIEEMADSIGVMKAREIINFAKQGRGDLIRVARATTPFFGAALNSLDVMARAISPEKIGSLSKAEAMEARRNFYSTAMMVAMFSTAYAAAMSEDEDYLKNPDRKGNWLIPIGGGKFVKIPIPFEAGWFVKELPELATLLSLGAINKSEAITEGKTAFKENVLPPMPTIFSIEPLAEVAMDHDFYTGSSLEGRDADVAVRDRNTKAGELTKAIVNKMEDYGINFLGVSANQLEHLNKSYLGQVWAITRTASDAYLNRGKVTPEKTLSEYPMIGGIISEGKKDRAVDQFYRVYGQVSEIDKSEQRAVSIGNKERFDQIVNDPENQKALRASDTLRDIKKQIGEKRTGIAKIKEMKGITSEEMTKRINVLKEHEKVLAKRGVEVARKLGLEI